MEHNRLMTEAGWHVVPFSMHNGRNLETPWADYFIDELEYGEAYTGQQKAVRALKSIYSFEARKKVRALVDSVKPDICHAHNIYHHISPSILSVLKRNGIPTVMTLHDLKIACPAYKMYTGNAVCESCKGNKLYNVVVNRCLKDSTVLSTLVMLESVLHKLLGSYAKNVNRFIVPSQFYMDKFVEWGWEPERFIHIPNFVDVREAPKTNNIGTEFLYFGRLSNEKGVSTLIKAAALAGVRLLIAGSGPEEAALIELARAEKADVSFLGYRSGSVLEELVLSARATILPSEWYENAPMSVLESYMHGKPVIGAEIGGIPELIKKGITGETFRSGDAEALAAVLKDFRNRSDSEIRDMGQNARTWVEKDFTREKYRERVINLYQDIGVKVSEASRSAGQGNNGAPF